MRKFREGGVFKVYLDGERLISPLLQFHAESLGSVFDQSGHVYTIARS